MPVKRALLLLVLLASAALSADPPELRPVKGEKFKGDLVGLTNKDIVLQVNGKPQATPVDAVLLLEFRAPANPTGSYTQVELTDGSVLRCAQVQFKVADAMLTLVSGQTATVPMRLLSSVMKEANDVKLVAAWKELLGGSKRAYDALVVKKQTGSLGFGEGTFYEASPDGKTIAFKRQGSEEKENFSLEKIHGMVFSRPPDPNMPSRLCEVFDVQGARLFAKNAFLKDGKVVIETQCGARIEYTTDALAKLDYSKGKLTYLSQMDLARVKLVQVPYLNSPEFKRDRNVDGGELRLAGKKYENGLGMHARTEVTFDLEGEYREFKAVAGIDDNVSQGDGSPVVVKVEGDGKELLTLSLTRKDGAKPISLNIKDVQRLRIVVDKSPDSLGIGSHMDLADAKVSK
jgi:hypothetical protein